MAAELGSIQRGDQTCGNAGRLPKVAIHGTNRPDVLGQYASNGCIRLPNDVISMSAAEVQVGTRVDLIRSS
ncbi:MAG: L,D-transpeptidase [Acidimicrobiales bacterium]